VLHVWDTRVDSGLNLDDSLIDTPIEQRIVSRVSVHQRTKSTLQESSTHNLKQIKSPYPENIFLRFYSQAVFKRQVISAITDYQPDLIFFHFGQCAVRFVKAIEKLKIPFVVALYGHDLSVALQSKRWRKKYRIFARTNGGFLVLAEDSRKRLLLMGVPNNQISLYVFPLDIERFLKVERKPASSVFRVTIPGRFVEKKGHKYLLEAISLLKVRQILIHLTILGYGDRETYLDYIEALGIQDQVSWVDTSEATIKGEFNTLYADVLSQSDLVALPCTTSIDGDNEAGPALVLCLAQAAGVPVMTTAFEGHEVSIVSGITGLIANEKDSHDLANKIEWIISHPMEIAEIAHNGRELIQRMFGFKITVEKLYTILKAEMKRQENSGQYLN
jgi:glycosyltransferase involved in cell wall biosynthesis